MVDLQDQITRAACEEIRERGAAGLRLEHIAASCNISVSLIYKYVGNRHDVVLAGTERWAAEEAATFEADLTEMFSAVSSIDALAREAMAYVVEQDGHDFSGLRWGLAEGVALSLRHPEVAEASSASRARGIAVFSAAIERIMVAEGGTPLVSASSLSRFLLSLWYGNLIAALNTQVTRHPDEVAALLFEVVTRVVSGSDEHVVVDPSPASVIPGRLVFPDPIDRREAILRAATEEIVDVGMSEFMLKSVSVRAGVSPSHVHYYFKSIAELIAAATIYRTNVALAQWELSPETKFDHLDDAAAVRHLFSQGARRSLSGELMVFRHETVESIAIARNHPASLAAAVETSNQVRNYWLRMLRLADANGLLKSDQFSLETIASFIQTLVYGLYLFNDRPVGTHELIEWQVLYGTLANVIMTTPSA